MLKVLFVSAEAAPLAKVGGLGDVAGALPKALKNLGLDVRLVIPRYQAIDTPSKLPGSQVPVYYVSSAKYFDRDEIYGYADDEERFRFFSRAVLELTKKEKFEPDIIHVNDYHTALIPELLRTDYGRDPFFAATRSVLTIHNLANQGGEMLRRGIETADIITTVSPTYAKEILTKEFGAGLDGVLRVREDRLHGILNGIDTEVYDPETDPNLTANFSVKNVAKRGEDKRALLAELGLAHPEWPLFAMIARLVTQKGVDLVTAAMGELSRKPFNLAILGLGERQLEDRLHREDVQYENMVVKLEFNEGLARRMYAGSDFFLVPSLYEPAGLTQMIAMRYGSIPVVRRTGGLADTVFDGRNGLTFDRYSVEALLATIERAIELFGDQQELAKMQRRGMQSDYSWRKPAEEYVKLYREALKLPQSHES